MNAFINKVTKADQKVALDSFAALFKNEDKVLNKDKKVIALKIQGLDEEISIPVQAFLLLKSILNNMAMGKSMTLLLSGSELSTQQAADVLNVSRPHVIKLLENGTIPYKKVGSHRRVMFNDLMDYEAKIKKERRKKLDMLAKDAQELNLGY